MNKFLLIIMTICLADTAAADTVQLFESAKKNDLLAVQTLLDNGEPVNAVNERGNTALHYAVANGNAEMTRFLLNRGADMFIQNNKGWSPLKIAEKKNMENIYGIFQEKQERDSLLLQQKSAQETVKSADNQTSENNPENKEIIKSDETREENPANQAGQVNVAPAEVNVPVVNMSPLSDRVNIGDEEIIYCLGFLGLSGEQKNMTTAAGYFAVEAGVSKERHDVVLEAAKVYFENASENAIKQRAEECSSYITPKQTAKQNQIIRSLNKSMGY